MITKKLLKCHPILKLHSFWVRNNIGVFFSACLVIREISIYPLVTMIANYGYCSAFIDNFLCIYPLQQEDAAQDVLVYTSANNCSWARWRRDSKKFDREKSYFKLDIEIILFYVKRQQWPIAYLHFTMFFLLNEFQNMYCKTSEFIVI